MRNENYIGPRIVYIKGFNLTYTWHTSLKKLSEKRVRENEGKGKGVFAKGSKWAL